MFKKFSYNIFLGILLLSTVTSVSFNNNNDYIVQTKKNLIIPNSNVISRNFKDFDILKIHGNSTSMFNMQEEFGSDIKHMEIDSPVWLSVVDKEVVDKDVDKDVENNLFERTRLWGLDQLDNDRDGRYTFQYSGSDVNAYIIDSGIFPHEDFNGRLLKGANFVDNSDPTNDCNGHGTHVASTVGGTKYGVAKKVNLIPVKVFPCRGGTYTSTIIRAMDWVYKQVTDKNNNIVKKSVVNMSIGGGASQAMTNAVKELSTVSTVVVAAGNSNYNACFYSPSRSKEAITVGAFNINNVAASFSNWGTCVDIFGPGVNIEGADNKKTGSVFLSGTSMSSPHVCGIAAQITGASKLGDLDRVKEKVKSIAVRDMLSLKEGRNSPNINARVLSFSNVVPSKSPTTFPTNSPTVFNCDPNPVPTPQPTIDCTAKQNRVTCNKWNHCRWKKRGRRCIFKNTQPSPTPFPTKFPTITPKPTPQPTIDCTVKKNRVTCNKWDHCSWKRRRCVFN